MFVREDAVSRAPLLANIDVSVVAENRASPSVRGHLVSGPSQSTTSTSGGLAERNNAGLAWGVGILTVSAVITGLTYLAAQDGGLVMFAWGGLICGIIKIATGWREAETPCRFVAVVTVLLIAVAGVFVAIAGASAYRDHNSVEVGDCLNGDGRVVDCDRNDARFTVESTKLFPAEQTAYPSAADLHVCPGLGFYPTPESWEQGDRLVACIEGQMSDLSDNYRPEVGDCVNSFGLLVACESEAAQYVVVSTKRFPDDMTTYPGIEEFDVCPGMAFRPRPEGWEQGDRLVLCVE